MAGGLEMVENRREKKFAKRKWVVAVACLALLALIFMIVMIIYIVKYHNAVNRKYEDLAGGEDERSEKVFSDLTKKQYDAISKYMLKSSNLGLVTHSEADLNSNYMHSIEPIIPPKDQVLKYLDGETDNAPTVKAKVTLFMGGSNPKAVKELIVYPLDSPTTMEDFVNPKKQVPTWQSRPTFSPETSTIYNFLKNALKPLTSMLKDQFGTWLDDTCDYKDTCLFLLYSPKVVPGHTDRHVLVSFHFPPGRLDMYVWPVPLSVVVYTPANGDTFEVKSLFYDNIEYSTVSSLLEAYNGGRVKTFQPGVAKKYEDSFGNPNRRGADVNPNNLPPPTQETSVRRFSVNNRHVKWLGWEYDFIFSPLSSAQLYNVKFNGERIAYQLGLQDVYVKYTGPVPANTFRNYMDVSWNLGLSATKLSRGYDCPDSAKFISGTVYQTGSEGVADLEDVVCIFEYRNHAPLRRHRSADYLGTGSPRFHMNLPDVVLVFRQILTVFNYDYIVDVELHQTGVIQMSAHPTGYIQVGTPERGLKYGYDLLPECGILGLFHSHFFLFKADIDVGNEGLNRFKTLDLMSTPRPHPYNNSASLSYAYIQESLKTTEEETIVHYHFSKPKEYIIYNNAENNTRNLQPRGYRIHSGSFANIALPEDDPLLTLPSWVNHQIAVTKYKDEELTTVSYFSTGDPYNPVISLKYFQEDNESILDEDLVCWVTLGVNHIPTAEDLPVTTTAGKTASLYLIPHNYYVEDPSIASRDAVVDE